VRRTIFLSLTWDKMALRRSFQKIQGIKDFRPRFIASIEALRFNPNRGSLPMSAFKTESLLFLYEGDSLF
jgi:hypothetical protein